MAKGFFGRVLSGAVGVARPAGAAGFAFGPDRTPSDVHQGRRTDLPEQVRVVPSPRLDCADVAADLRGGSAVGPLDPRARRVAQHAALAHRQERRHPALQGRPIAQQKEIDTIVRGSARLAAGRSRRTCRAPIKWADGNGWNYAKQFGSRPT